MMNVTRVLTVDDHVVVRRGVQMLLGTDASIQLVGEAESGPDAVRNAKALQPDVVLLDLVMPNGDGIESIAEIKRSIPDVKIIVLTTFGDEARAKAAIEAGADGYLLKDADGEALLAAIHAVQRGDMPIHPHVAPHLIRNHKQFHTAGGIGILTEREKEVLQLVAQGLSNKAIAEALTLSPGTVKVHVSNILGKLNVSSRTEASVLALRSSLIPSVGDM
jgi:DNA-binding NarL/FixJ family response regulator